MSLQKLEKMPMLCERGRTSDMVVEVDVSVACWSCEAILRGFCCAEVTEERARSDSNGAEDLRMRYMVWECRKSGVACESWRRKGQSIATARGMTERGSEGRF